MTVHFSKTEQLVHDLWVATISPSDYRKGVRITEKSYVSDKDFFGVVESVNGAHVNITCRCKFPCVGRDYKVEVK